MRQRVELARRYGPWAMVAGASQLKEKRAVEARTAAVDLASTEFLPALQGAAEGLEIGLLVCNAAVSKIGPFLSHPLQEYLQLIDTNCRAHLARWLTGRARRWRDAAGAAS